MAKVCNPIYDTVFKYLVDDERVAKVLLGGILNKKIVSVEIKGHDCAYQSDEGSNLKLLRFDFAGTIENPDGTKETVTIELQKASEPEEVMRFRKYFGLQMASEANADAVTKYRRDKEKTPYIVKKPRHIYGIFILGHSLGKGFEYSLIKGNPVFYDEDNNVLNFKTQCEFLKGMTYDLYIIQIPFLPEKPKKPLEKILRAFDQRYKLEYDSKYLELSEDKDDDSGYNVIFRRLLYAAADEQLRGNLDLEDYAERLYAIRAAEKEDLEDELKEKNQLLVEQKSQLMEQENQLAKKDQQLAAMIKFSASFGATPNQIAAQLNISIDEVKKVL
ncbi:MAG: hypothetical protein K5685_08985 [Bacteroidales bacterium]|nr:hypothetical protein [Bacteroidales bacterium]